MGGGDSPAGESGGGLASVTRVQCMLPLIDLFNHAAPGSCTLSLRESAHRGRCSLALGDVLL